MFSDYFIQLLEKFHFYKIVIARFFIIFFKRNRRIELLYIDYNSQHLFYNGFIIINYSFKNAIYYKFGNNKTLEKAIKIFNLKEIENEFAFTVYGFFSKKIFRIILNPNVNLDSSSFDTKFSKLKIELVEVKSIKIIYSEKYPKINKLKINAPKVKVENKKIIFKNDSFNQNEYI